MRRSASIGIHLDSFVMHAAYIEAGTLQRLDDIPLSGRGSEFFWRGGDHEEFDYFTPRDLIAINLSGPNDILIALRPELNQLIEQASRNGLDVDKVVIAAPASMSACQQSTPISSDVHGVPPTKIISLITAAVYAYESDQESSFLVFVIDDLSLELAVAKFSHGAPHAVADCRIIKELSWRELDHHILQLVFDQIPASVRRQLVSNKERLNQLLSRLIKSRGAMGRIETTSIPVRASDTEEAIVTVGRKDLEAFFLDRFPLVEASCRELQSTLKDNMERVILVGNFGDLPDLTAKIQELLGAVQVSSLQDLAAGAALAAQQPFDSGLMASAPQIVNPAQYAAGLANKPLRVGLIDDSVPALVDRLFNEILHVVESIGSVAGRELLSEVARRVEAELLKLNVPAESDRQESHREKYNNARDKHTLQLSPRTERALSRAERALSAGDALEAVAHSHRAYNSAPDDHSVLMAMLDIHRRAANLLSAPSEFEMARLQLACALEHRRNDVPTRRALAKRIEEHALYLESKGKLSEATSLLEEALEIADNEDEILSHLDRLER